MPLRRDGVAMGFAPAWLDAATVPVSQLSRQILPWTAVGFGIMALSGAGLVFSEPLRFYSNIFFRIKLALLAFAGLNAFVFHQTVGRRKEEWDLSPLAPFRARMAGALSLGLWAGVIVTGRLIAYNWFGAVRPECFFHSFSGVRIRRSE